MKNMKEKTIFAFVVIIFSLFIGYLAGLQTTTLKPSCSDLNSSISQYQCEAIKNPISEQGIGYFSMWIMFSPFILILAIVIGVSIKGFKIILVN